MKYIIKNIIPAAALALALGVTSCTKDLDVDPMLCKPCSAWKRWC